MRRATGLLIWAALLAPGYGLAQQASPPERIGPVWDFRDHQPTPAEIEARERARGLPQENRMQQDAREVDQLYRDLTGASPQSPPQSTRSRDADRR